MLSVHRPSNGNLTGYHSKTSNNQEVQAWGLGKDSTGVKYLPSYQDFSYKYFKLLHACREIELRIGQLINPVGQASLSLCIQVGV